MADSEVRQKSQRELDTRRQGVTLNLDIVLPEGWRWLRVGEVVQKGDVVCDPRVTPQPEWLVHFYGGCVTEKHMPIRRKTGQAAIKETN